MGRISQGESYIVMQLILLLPLLPPTGDILFVGKQACRQVGKLTAGRQVLNHSKRKLCAIGTKLFSLPNGR